MNLHSLNVLWRFLNAIECFQRLRIQIQSNTFNNVHVAIDMHYFASEIIKWRSISRWLAFNSSPSKLEHLVCHLYHFNWIKIWNYFFYFKSFLDWIYRIYKQLLRKRIIHTAKYLYILINIKDNLIIFFEIFINNCIFYVAKIE